MPKFQLINVEVAIDVKDGNPYTIVPKVCTAPEIEVLRHIYGSDQVRPVSHAGWVERDMPEEGERLHNRYCRNDKYPNLVRSLFPGRVPIMPLESADIAAQPGDIDAKMTIESLKAEFLRRNLKLPAGKPTIRRLKAKLDGDVNFEDDPAEAADAHADA